MTEKRRIPALDQWWIERGHDPLPCGCVPGERLCPEAKKLHQDMLTAWLLNDFGALADDEYPVTTWRYVSHFGPRP
jgi:hypothetical protein